MKTLVLSIFHDTEKKQIPVYTETSIDFIKISHDKNNRALSANMWTAKTLTGLHKHTGGSEANCSQKKCVNLYGVEEPTGTKSYR